MRAKITKAAPYVVLGLVFLMMVFLNIFYQDQWMDSDMAAEMVFSRVLSEGGHFFATPDWYYATEFRFLFTHWIMGPLFKISDNWHLIRTITHLVSYALILVSYFFMLKPLKISGGLTALMACVLLLPFSETMMFYMQMSNFYIPHSMIIIFFFGMFLRLAGKTEYKKWQKIFLLVCYIVLALICGVSGIRYLLVMQCPLVVAGFFYWLMSEEFAVFRKEFTFDRKTWENAKKLFQNEKSSYFYYSLLGAVGSLVGYGINVVWVSKQYVFQTYDATNFIDIYQGDFLERFQNAFGCLLMFFGYIPQKGVLSLRGIITLISFVMVALFVYCTVKAYKKCQGIRFFVALFVTVAFAINVFAFIFTTSTMVPRYYITILIFALPVVAFYLEEEKMLFDKTLVSLILIGCLTLSSAKTFYSYITVDKNETKRPVAEFLAENDYHFGFATFNNANVITELTNGDVEIANVWDPKDLNYFKWSSPVKYYEEDYHTGETFLLLTAEEAAAFADAQSVKQGKIVYDDGCYIVYLYDSVAELMSYGNQSDRNR